MLKFNQIERILQQISKNILLYIGINLGEEVLSEVDRTLLTAMGIRLSGLGGEFPAFYRMFLLGRLTQLIGDYNANRLNYSDFEAYLKKRQFQPLSAFEQIQYELARQATYTHLKNLENRIRTDVSGMIVEPLTRVEYESIIKKEIERGVLERRAVRAVVSNIGHATGDWQKDLERIVDTEMNNIYQRGRAVQIARENPGRDPLVYKDVFPGACRHCIRLFLTHGLDSEPRVFRLSELLANGTNIGRKVQDWRATVGGVHPWCRCNLRFLEEGKRWDKEKRQFVWDERALKQEERRLGIRGKIKVQVGNKVFEV
jgi:hypothetical protein